MATGTLTPIVLFAYNRPDTLQKVLDALKKQTVLPRKLIAFSDASRDASDNQVLVVRQILDSVDWIDIEVQERPANLGCAQNIVQGLTEVFTKFSQAVVVEDDVLPAQHFYESMCIIMEQYRDNPDIFSVGGYPSIQRTIADYPYDVILSPRFSAWGWGTWSDRWSNILGDLRDPSRLFMDTTDVPTTAGTDLPYTLNALKERPGFYWDIPVALSCLKRGKLHALTNYYLTNNIGLTSGIHGNASQRVLNFFDENNPVQEKAPARFLSNSKEYENVVSSAIQSYLDAASQAGRPPKSIGKRIREFLNM